MSDDIKFALRDWSLDMVDVNEIYDNKLEEARQDFLKKKAEQSYVDEAKSKEEALTLSKEKIEKKPTE